MAPLLLSVVIPAYNEARRLPPTLEFAHAYLERRFEDRFEIVVVDDGSTDETVSVCERFADRRVRVLKQSSNQGKGAAVRRGMLDAAGDRILYMDADGATPMDQLEGLEREVDRGAEIAFGSRALESGEKKVTTVVHRRVLGRIFNAFVNLLAVPGVADTQCGFKLFTRRAARFVFERQTATGFSFDVEILMLAQRAGIPIAEVPVSWTNIPGTKVNIAIDSLKMFRDTVLFRWLHRDVPPGSYKDL